MAAPVRGHAPLPVAPPLAHPLGRRLCQDDGRLRQQRARLLRGLLGAGLSLATPPSHVNHPLTPPQPPQRPPPSHVNYSLTTPSLQATPNHAPPLPHCMRQSLLNTAPLQATPNHVQALLHSTCQSLFKPALPPSHVQSRVSSSRTPRTPRPAPPGRSPPTLRSPLPSPSFSLGHRRRTPGAGLCPESDIAAAPLCPSASSCVLLFPSSSPCGLLRPTEASSPSSNSAGCRSNRGASERMSGGQVYACALD